MTVAVETPSVNYAEDGVTLAFPIPFSFAAASDVRAYRSVLGVETALTYGTAYSVAGGTLTLAATVAGATLSIRRETSRAQSADYTATGAFTAESHESALDRLARVDREQDVEIGRALRIPRGEAPMLLPGSLARAGAVFGFDSYGAASMVSNLALASALATPIAALLPAQLKGDPGGNAASVGLFSALGAMTIPAGTDRITTSGRTVVGQYPATYIRGGDQGDAVTGLLAELQTLYNGAADKPTALAQLQALQGRIATRDAAGVLWIIDETAQAVHAGHWGAIPDGAYNDITGAMTGTDAQPAIQAFVDWRGYIFRHTARDANTIPIPAGMFRLGSPLRTGYGQQNGVILAGAGRMFNEDAGGGTLLLADFSAHAAINVTNNFWGGTRDLTVYGKSRHWIKGNAFAETKAKTTPDDIDLANWHDATNFPAASPLARYAPYAGVAIDPFRGVKPAGGYPELAIPAWVEAAYRGSIYGAWGGTTVPFVGSAGIEGFAVGYCGQPSDADGNGDFLRMHDSHVGLCGVAVSIGNTQARNNDFRGCNFNRCHTILASALHGRQNGRAQGVFLNCSASEIVKVVALDNSSSVWGPVTFTQFYVENLWTIGTVEVDALSSGALVFGASSFNFNLHGTGAGERGAPRALIWHPTNPGQVDFGGNSAVRFADCSLAQHLDVAAMPVKGLLLDGTQLRPVLVDAYAGAPAGVPLWKRSAMNALSGGLAIAALDVAQVAPMRIVHDAFHQHTLASGPLEVRSEPGARWPTRNYPAGLHVANLTPAGGFTAERIANFQGRGEYAKAALTANAFNAGTGVWTFTVNADERTANLNGMCPGGALMDSDGFVFFVSARGGVAGAWTITAQLMNGYRVDAGGATRSYPEGAFAPAVGNVYGYSGRFFTPPIPAFFDSTAASAAIANVTRDDGTAAVAPLAVGDWLYADVYRDKWHDGVSRIATITSPNLTLAGNSAKTARRRMELVQCAQP